MRAGSLSAGGYAAYEQVFQSLRTNSAALFRGAVRIVSALEFLAAKFHEQVFSVLSYQRSQFLTFELPPRLRNPIAVVEGKTLPALVGKTRHGSRPFVAGGSSQLSAVGACGYL